MGFRTMVVSAYILGSIYVLWRLGRLFSTAIPIKNCFRLVGALLCAAFPLGIIGSQIFPGTLSDLALRIGFYMLPVLLYTGMASLAIDLYDALSHLLPLPTLTLRLRRTLWIGGGFFVFAMVAGGYVNAQSPRLHEMTVTLPAPCNQPNVASMRIVVVTDIHAGAMVHNSRLHRIVNLILAASPDVVLLVGDMVDGNISDAQEAELAEELQRIEAPLGVFAVSGNHEYYAGIDKALSYIRQGNVRVLEDEAVTLGDRLRLVGRVDVQSTRFGYERKPLNELLLGASRDLPVLVMDHAPLFDEAAAAGVALQFSGHTHNGQLFPFNFLVHRLFGFGHGWHRQGKTRFYVSPGVGTWGPPVRTTARPEVVLCVVRFSHNAEKPGK